MKKYTEVNGRIFEVKKSIEKTDRTRERKDLHECYKRPSDIKDRIFWEWKHYVLASFENVSNFGIESYNGFMFTLGWTTPDGEWYVTKTRQEFYPYK